MKVTVLSIKSAQAPNSHEVLLSIGEERQVFRFTTEVNQVGDRQLQTTQAEPRFSDFFRWNQRVAMQVSQLVVKFYNQEAIELPAHVGDFFTPEEAVSNLKPVKGNWHRKIGDGSKERFIEPGQTAERSQQIRQQAIALIEKLPESLLNEAVQVLESLSVKANN